MNDDPFSHSGASSPEAVLRVYLLGSVEFEAALRLQKALLYETAGSRQEAALVLCEHPPVITVGRHGGPADVQYVPEELRTRRWRVRWVNRGGGTWLHLPGQLAVYPILPLDRLGLGLDAYLGRMGRVLVNVLDDFGVNAEASGMSVRIDGRPIAVLGAAVRDWVTYFGAVLNVHPDLTAFRQVRCGPGEAPMTSLVRERRGGLRPALVRQRLIEHFTAVFPCDRTSVFFHHPLLGRPELSGTVAARPGSI